ncbi:MAG TPA: flagellar type III secretion system pore protein FliP [Kofleriaceae bacterium]|jgi:type III secretion protein R|nr:flagellar type III secretion system pore protein FliP [Kofleriaceae bacterium]
MTGGLGNAALVAVVALVPLIGLMLTSFVKISVVLSLLRNAIGAPEAPSGLVVMGLSLLLTCFVMMPVALDMVHAAAEAAPAAPVAPALPAPSSAAATPGTTPPPPSTTPPLPPGSHASPPTVTPHAATGRLDLDGALRVLVPAQYLPEVDAAARALVPLRGFLARHAGPRDRETFTGFATRMGRTVQGDEIWVLAPAFVTTELREAFAIAVLIFLPFLVVDLVVGLGLAALGLASTSPQAIALPLKLLLLVSVDGWRLLIDGLLRGYA